MRAAWALGMALGAALGTLACGANGAAAQGIDLSHGGPVQVNAAGGIDWVQNTQEVIAHGDARAVRGNVTVTADQLIAHYRKKAPTPGQPAPARTPAAKSGDPTADDTQGTEVYRLDAVGNVHIFTPTDQAFGDKAVYDMDQSVLVLTGKHLKLITPQDVLTAKDSMEYWPQQHMAVARGHAVVVTNDARRIAADVLVAYTAPGTGNPAPPTPGSAATTPVATPVAARTETPKPGADPLTSAGKLQKVDAFGNVDVRTPTETVYGDRGVYVPDTQRAHILGHVRITRGQNQLNGNAAEVDMKTGLATLLSGRQERVRGLIVPSDAQAQGKQSPTKGAGGKATPAKKAHG
jgi:lipopolysaccharide export system protein LptA